MKESFLNFENRSVVVTGGTKGIGAAIVKKLLHYGANVIIADVDESGEETADQYRKKGLNSKFVYCDVSNSEQVNKLFANIVGDVGGIDVLVNNAGIFPRADLQETNEVFWEKVMGVNLKGSYLMCRAAVPGMIRKGGGNIVNIGSLHASRGEDNTMAYAVSKGGIVTLTRNLAFSLNKHRIRVNGVHPGWVASEGEVARINAMGMDMDFVQDKLATGGMQTGEDVANAVAFLASDLANQITGEMITVSGGLGLR